MAFLAAAAALVLLFTLTHDGRTAAKTALFMAHLIPDAPARPLNWMTGEPTRLPLRFGPSEEGWEAE